MHKPTLDWVCGLYEGEGSTFVSKSGQPYVAVEMTDRDVVQRFADFFGLNVTGPSLRSGSIKPLWRAQSAKRSKVREILSKMLPSLGDRRAHQALNVLDHLECS